MQNNIEAKVRYLQTQITIELARAAAYSADNQLQNARGCLERADNCNDLIYCLESGQMTLAEVESLSQ